MLRFTCVIGHSRFISESVVDLHPMVNLSELKSLPSRINLDLSDKWLRTRLISTREQIHRWLKLRGDKPDDSVEEVFREQLHSYLQKHHLGANLANLNEIIVDPRLVVPKQVWDPNDDKPPDAYRLYEFWPDLAGEIALAPPPNCTVRQFLQQSQRVVISGKHGTGKTTFLVYLALLCLNREHSNKYSFMGETLPVFIHLAEFDLYSHPVSSAGEDQTGDPMAVLSTALSDRFDNIGPGELDSLLCSKTNQGKLLLLIDGWDESESLESLPYVNWLDQFLDMYPDCQIIVSGPTRGLGPMISRGFMVSGLLPWRKGQVETFCQAWSAQLNRGQPISPEDYWRPGQTTLETHLRLSLLGTEEGIPYVNPPVRTVELMEAYLIGVLGKMGTHLPGEWQTRAIQSFWQFLAFTLVKGRQVVALESDVKEIARTVLKSFLADIDESAINNLRNTLVESCLFVIYPNGNVGFLSPLIRDYLAAVYIARSRERDQAGSYFDDPYWSGVLKLVVGRIGAMSLLKQLHQIGRKLTEDDLFSLAEWLPEAQDHQQWRRQVLIGLGQIILNQENPISMRQRAIAILSKTGEEGVSDLLNQLLSKPEPAIQQITIAAFARVSPAEAIPLNQRMMSDAEEIIRVANTHSLAWIDDEATEKPLVKALLEPDEPVKEAAAVGLAMNGSKVSKEILAEALTEKAMSVRLAAVHGLSLIEDDWSTKLLEKVVETDENRLVKSAAENAILGRKDHNHLEKWQPVLAGEQQWLIDWALKRGEIVPVGPAAVALILKALSDEDATIRAAAARTLAILSVKQAIKPVANLHSDPDPDVRAAAKYASERLNKAWEAAI